MKTAPSIIKKSNFYCPIFHTNSFRARLQTDGSNRKQRVGTHGQNLCRNTDYFLIVTIFVTLTSTCGWEMGFTVGAGRGLRKLFMASVKRQICLGLHFLPGVSLSTYSFQMRSVWAGQSAGPACLTAGLRMWLTATLKLKDAADRCHSISHY